MVRKINRKAVLFNLLLTLVLAVTLGVNYREEQLVKADIANMQGPPPSIGAEMPEFIVKNASNQQLHSSELIDGNTLLILWNSGCLPSLKSLEALWEIGQDSQVKLLPVNIYDPSDQVAQLFQERGWDLPVLVDSKNSTRWAFKASITPAIYLINSEGTIIHRQLGLSEKGLNFLEKVFSEDS